MVNEKSFEEKGLSLSDLFFSCEEEFTYDINYYFLFHFRWSNLWVWHSEQHAADATAIVMAESTSTTNGYQDYLYSNYLINTFKDFIVSESVIELVKEELSDYNLTKRANR